MSEGTSDVLWDAFRNGHLRYTLYRHLKSTFEVFRSRVKKATRRDLAYPLQWLTDRGREGQTGVMQDFTVWHVTRSYKPHHLLKYARLGYFIKIKDRWNYLSYQKWGYWRQDVYSQPCELTISDIGLNLSGMCMRAATQLRRGSAVGYTLTHSEHA